MNGRGRAARAWAFALVAVLASSCGTYYPNRPTMVRPWLTAERVAGPSGIVIERVSYRSGPLTIDGDVCRPRSGGRHPLLMWNHGGFGGIDDLDPSFGLCVRFARLGWVVAESSYRGEDGSDGRVEVCSGEVDDVLAMLRIVRTQAYVDPERTAMAGVSHGGCITARAVAAGADVDLAVDMSGPTDWSQMVESVENGSDLEGSALEAIRRDVAGAIEQAVGGSPQQFPERYAGRSPDAGRIGQWRHPFLILHGSADSVVPVAQSCALAAAIGRFRVAQVDGYGAVEGRLPAGCERLAQDRARPSFRSSDADRYLLTYAGVDHNGWDRMFDDLEKFVQAKLGCLSDCVPTQNGF